MTEKKKKLTKEKRMDKLRLMKMFQPNFSQISAAKKLQVSRQTIASDFSEIKNQNKIWMDDMLDNGFTFYLEKWFRDTVLRIEDRTAAIKQIENAKPEIIKTLITKLSPLISDLPKQESKFIVITLTEYETAANAMQQATPIMIIENTITTMIARCERILMDYPVLKTTKAYAAYLEKFGDKL